MSSPICRRSSDPIAHVDIVKERNKSYDEQLTKVLSFIKQKKFGYTQHCIKRMAHRGVTERMIESVLLHGTHWRDRWVVKNKNWVFEFRHNVDGNDIRVRFVAGKDSAKVITSCLQKKIFMDMPTCWQDSPISKAKTLSCEELNTSFDDLLEKKSRKRKSISSTNSNLEKTDPSLTTLKIIKTEKSFSTRP